MRVKKLKHIVLFVLGVVAVFSLIATRHYFQLFPAHGDTGNLVVFDDHLSPNFANWSWNSSVDLNNSSSVFSGSTAIAFTPSAWGGLYLHTNTVIDPTQYTSLQFALQTTDQEKNFTLYFYNANNNQIQPGVSLSQYPGINQNGWKVYTIPFNSQIKGFALQETSGNAGPTTYVDSVQFIANQPSPTQATLTTMQSYPIYTDSLATGWTNWSWNSSVNFANTATVNQGSDAISFTATSGYGGMYLHTDTGVDTTPYTMLTFAAKATVDGGIFAVASYDANNQQLHAPISLGNYGGQATASAWKTYTIPLSDLNANGKTIKGILIQDTTGHSQQPLYIDTIALSSTVSTSSQTSTTTPAPTAVPTAIINSTMQNINNPLAGLSFFNDISNDPAQQQTQQWQSSRPQDAAMISKIANQPKAIWLGNWNTNVQSDVENEMNKAESVHQLPVFVSYNIPNRDCGSYSTGGSSSTSSYELWIDNFAGGIGNRRAAVILEPDALAQIGCLSQADQQQRLAMLSYAVGKFKSLGQTAVYIDAGNAGWIDVHTMAARLASAGINQADGFALNVSNFDSDNASISYGKELSALVANKHFVIDTSRNGNGPTADNTWCNPPGRALGDKPTTQTGNPLIDAYLWIKYPGESDGSCNGAPPAGAWYPSYALGLAQQAKW